MNTVIEELFLLECGLLRRAAHPELRSQLNWLLAAGEIIAPLPGVLALPQVMTEPSSLIKAAVLWGGPDTVLTGWAAARQTFWPQAPLPFVSVAVPGKAKPSRPGWRVQQRRIPVELIVEAHGTRFTNAALTAATSPANLTVVTSSTAPCAAASRHVRSVPPPAGQARQPGPR